MDGSEINLDVRYSEKQGSVTMSRNGRIYIYTLAIIFVLVGSLMLGLNIHHISNGVELDGVVVGYQARDQSFKGRSGSTDAPIVRFEYQGQQLEIPSQMSSAWHGYAVGDEVKLYYDPENRNEILLDSIYHKYGFGGMFLIFGLFMGALPRILSK